MMIQEIQPEKKAKKIFSFVISPRTTDLKQERKFIQVPVMTVLYLPYSRKEMDILHGADICLIWLNFLLFRAVHPIASRPVVTIVNRKQFFCDVVIYSIRCSGSSGKSKIECLSVSNLDNLLSRFTKVALSTLFAIQFEHCSKQQTLLCDLYPHTLLKDLYRYSSLQI